MRLQKQVACSQKKILKVSHDSYELDTYKSTEKLPSKGLFVRDEKDRKRFGPE